ncbi:MAG: hypothetical protein PHX89_07800 [bacterium]|jgi:hypothetical protein|nr:hypothetical protein [bacterium]
MKKDSKRFILYNLPLRGNDTPPIWSNWEMAVGLKEMIDKYGLFGTWLPRYDVLYDSRYIDLCTGLDKRHELGLWLEITSSHAAAGDVPYRIGPGEEWFWAKHALTMGYSQAERRRLIDVAMARFYELFHHYPKVVSMWMIDSFSAEYMSESYGVKAIGLCRNQYGIDGYTLWGGWQNLPYWPCRENLWQPAPTRQVRGDALVYPLNTDDLLLSYGNEKGIWSTEIAILQLQDLPESMVDEHINKLTEHVLAAGSPVSMVSLIAENSWNWERFAGAYHKQAFHIANLQKESRAQNVTVSEFAAWYAGNYPEVSPSQVWYQPGSWKASSVDDTGILACTRRYRVRLRAECGSGLKLTDLRAYMNSRRDPYWEERSRERFARWITPFLLDGSRYRLNGNGDVPLTDIDDNRPMHFRPVLLSSEERCVQGKLSRMDERSFVWTERELVSEWRFEDDCIFVRIRPYDTIGRAGLQLVCNPQILDLAVTFNRERMLLSHLLPGNYSVSTLLLVNPSMEGAGMELAAPDRGEKKALDIRWETGQSVCWLTVGNNFGPELCLRLKLAACRPNAMLEVV